MPDSYMAAQQFNTGEDGDQDQLSNDQDSSVKYSQKNYDEEEEGENDNEPGSATDYFSERNPADSQIILTVNDNLQIR